MNEPLQATTDRRNNVHTLPLKAKDSDADDMSKQFYFSKRIGIYLRVSTKKQTTEQQEEELRLLARIYNLDLTNAVRYEDHDKSAFNPKYYRIEDRPRGKEMWADMEAGLLDTIVILEVDRCWRHGVTGVMEAEYISNPVDNEHGANGLGMKLVLALGGCVAVDLTTSAGFAAFWDAMGSAQREVMQTRERVIRKKEMNYKIGKANTGKTYGWDTDENGFVQPNNEQLAVLAHFIQKTTGRWAISGYSFAKKMNKLGVKTATGKGEFVGKSFTRPLTSKTHLSNAHKIATRYVEHPQLGRIRIGFEECVRPQERQTLAQEAKSDLALSY